MDDGPSFRRTDRLKNKYDGLLRGRERRKEGKP